ncbi:MAG: PEGA domain-containing protein [Treponemataceae bacterium]
MKKVLLLLLILAVTFSAAAQKTQAAFLGFESADLGASGLAILEDLVKQEISRSPDYSLVDINRRGELAKEIEFGLSDMADPSKTAKIGALSGAQKLIGGKIGILGSLYLITLDLVDVQTGTVERGITEEFVGVLEDLRKPVRIAAQKLLGIKGIEVAQGTFINVSSDPAGVGVYVDGLFEGSSPVKIKVPKAGRHVVKLATEGYKPWTQTVSVDDNATFFISAKLLKQEHVVDEKTKSLQDGRFSLALYAGLFAGVASDALIYTISGNLGGDNIRLAIGLPLVCAPLGFFGALMATESLPITGGRATMIITSSLWGSTWGLTAAFAFGAVSSVQNYLPGFVGLSVAGGILYGGIATWLTAGDRAFPAGRAWLFNLGSVLGSLLGLGIPYLFNVGEAPVIYIGMLTGSMVGSATAWFLTTEMSEGRNVGNLALGSALDIGSGGVRAGIPLAYPTPLLSRDGRTPKIGVTIPVLSATW